ncbi:hypothetical protein FJZ31_04045 [Candidatus Poribacteria bacterium]|nr:hypothetical protein [Candidatus Poribacteria bacterium]
MQKIIQKEILFEKSISPLTRDEFLLLIRYFSEEGFVSRYLEMLKRPILFSGLNGTMYTAINQVTSPNFDYLFSIETVRGIAYCVTVQISPELKIYVRFPEEIRSQFDSRLKPKIEKILQCSFRRMNIDNPPHISSSDNDGCWDLKILTQMGYDDSHSYLEAYQQLSDDVKHYLPGAQNIYPNRSSDLEIQRGNTSMTTEFFCPNCKLRSIINMSNAGDTLFGINPNKVTDCNICGRSLTKRTLFFLNPQDYKVLTNPEDGHRLEWWVYDCLREYEPRKSKAISDIKAAESRLQVYEKEQEQFNDWIKTQRDNISSATFSSPSDIQTVLDDIDQGKKSITVIFTSQETQRREREIAKLLSDKLPEAKKSLLELLEMFEANYREHTMSLQRAKDKRQLLELTYIPFVDANIKTDVASSTVGDLDVIACIHNSFIHFSCKKTLNNIDQVMELHTTSNNLQIPNSAIVTEGVLGKRAAHAKISEISSDFESAKLLGLCQALNIPLVLSKTYKTLMENLYSELLRLTYNLFQTSFESDDSIVEEIKDEMIV